jgi:RNA polymerase sigma-70 factor (ECF subfamily)
VRDPQKTIDETVRALVEAGRLDDAATDTLKAHGSEVFGFLLAIHRSEEDAADVFSIFSEKLWKSLRRFEWNCSLRAWSYTLARNASNTFLRDRVRRRRREVLASTSNVFNKVVVDVRTRTLTHLRTETKSAIQKLRETLNPDDQTLLIMRVDRGLEWADIASIFLSSEDGAADADALKREAARLRKRFQLVKERLTRLGKEQGLLRKSP